MPITDCALGVGASRPMEATTPQDFVAQEILNEVFQECDQAAQCSDTRVKEVYLKAVEKKGGRFKRFFRGLANLRGPAFVLTIWGGSSIGPGVVVYILSAMAGMPDALAGTAGTLFGVMSGVLFGRVISPFDKRWGAKVEQWANIVWNGEDPFSKLQQKIPETLRIANGQIYNMHFSVREYLRAGAKAVKRGQLKTAGMDYAMAVLNAKALFAGMHLDYYVTKRIARNYLRRLGVYAISDADRRVIIQAAEEYIDDLGDDELAADEARVELKQLMDEAIEGWLNFADRNPRRTALDEALDEQSDRWSPLDGETR